MGLRRGVQRVALKQLHSTGCDVRSLQQFLDEVRILQRVSFDKNIIQFYGTCKSHRLGPLLVMEYLEVCVIASARFSFLLALSCFTS